MTCKKSCLFTLNDLIFSWVDLCVCNIDLCVLFEARGKNSYFINLLRLSLLVLMAMYNRVDNKEGPVCEKVDKNS